MTVLIGNETYYRISEACDIAGTSRSSLLRWIRTGDFRDVGIRDRNGWRLFSEEDVKRLKTETSRINRRQQN